MLSALVFYPLNVASAPEAPKNNTVDHPKPYTRPVEVVPSSILANCYLYAKHIYPNLPPTKEIWANLTQEPGGVAVFKYASGLEHYAVVDFVGTSTISISETNFRAGTMSKRVIQFDDENLVGYFHVTTGP